MKTVIRAMGAADIPGARSLWEQSEGVHLSEGDEPEEVVAYLQRNPGISTVAERDGRIGGAVLCGHDGRRGVLYHLAVAPDLRGQGLARAMLDRSLAQLKEQGIRRALLLVATTNASGREFWLKQGWEEMAYAQPFALDL